jgi:hypothetical protein
MGNDNIDTRYNFMAHYLLNLLKTWMSGLGLRHCNEGMSKIQMHQDYFVDALGGNLIYLIYF